MAELPPGATLVDRGPQVPILGAAGESLPQPTPVPFDAETAFRTPQAGVSVMDQFLETTSVGRVLDAFGEGARQGWGPEQLGLSPESEKWLQDAGITSTGNPAGDPFWTFKAFNNALIRPAAAALDTIMRAPAAVIGGIAEGGAQTMAEAGAGRDASRAFRRETFAAAETLEILALSTGLALPIARRPPLRRGPSVDRAPDMPELEGPPPPPVRPTELFDTTETPATTPAGNINLDRISAPDDVKQVIREAALHGQMDDATRGTMTFAQTQELADALGMTPAALTKRNIGQAFNAEEVTAARTLLVDSATSVRSLAQKAAGGSEQDLLAFQEAMTKHLAIQEQVAGLTAEAGRALSSFRIMAQATGEAQDLSRIIEQFGGRGRIEDVARMIGELDTPGQISKFLMDSRKATTSDMLLEAWINGLLSGPPTHMTNVMSNTLISLWAVPETALAATIGKLRGADSVMFGEVGSRVFGFVQGATEGVRAGWRAYRTEIPTDPLTKLEVARPQALPSATVKVIDPKTFTFLGREIELSGKLTLGGKQVRVPGRLLMAEDEFFKAIGYRQELNAQAYRIAAKEGLTGQAFAARAAELVSNPTKAMLEAARATAEYQTFTKPLGPAGQAVQNFAAAHPLIKVVLPFIRTPVNILKYAGERTLLSVFSAEVRKNLSGANGAVARDTQLARMTMGTAVATAGVSLAAQGYVTGGGPKDPAERAMLYVSGWQPYSVRIGDMFYSFGRFEPIGTLLGVSADLYEISSAMSDPEAEDTAALLLSSISKNLVNKTWMQGPANLIEAVQDPDRYGQRYVQRLVGTMIPTGVAQITRVDDPYLRETRSIIDQVRSRVPGQSVHLPPKRDIWGEPIKLQGALGPDLVSPIYISRITNDPVNRELLALKIFPAKLDRQIRGVELTDEQYDEYQRVAGRLTKQTLNGLVAQEGWGQLPPFARIEIITKTVNRTREMARRLMLATHPDIIDTAVLDRVGEITGQ